jgi:REP element-mobilizing transposase RayT
MESLAAHVVFGAYGFWLPNDPRGSGSKYVGGENLFPFGKATFLEDRSRSVAGNVHNSQLRLSAKEALIHRAVKFAAEQIQLVGDGFGIYVRKKRITVWACAILPDHVHLVIAKHRMEYEILAGQLKNEATRSLKKAVLHPFGHLEENGETPTCWGGRGWKTYLYTEQEIIDRIRYVEENPLKAGLEPQHWPFVVKYPELFAVR